MPWFVSRRISGQFIGAWPTIATRMSVIFSSDGFEFVLTYDWYAWMSLSAQKAAPKPAAPAAFRNPRREDALLWPFLCFMIVLIVSLIESKSDFGLLNWQELKRETHAIFPIERLP